MAGWAVGGPAGTAKPSHYLHNAIPASPNQCRCSTTTSKLNHHHCNIIPTGPNHCWHTMLTIKPNHHHQKATTITPTITLRSQPNPTVTITTRSQPAPATTITTGLNHHCHMVVAKPNHCHRNDPNHHHHNVITAKLHHHVLTTSSANMITAKHDCTPGYLISNRHLRCHHPPFPPVPNCCAQTRHHKPSPTTVHMVLPVIALPGTTVAIKTQLTRKPHGYHMAQCLCRMPNPQRTQSLNLHPTSSHVT
ncbi:uncharacterized protein ACIBXB_019024 [Morphnus guianensis]